MDRNLKAMLALIAILGAVSTYLVVSQVIPFAEDDDSAGDQDIDSQDIIIETHEATMISTLFATLNGELEDMGDYSSVDVYFVWGENPGEYTMETPKQTITSIGEFSAEISDLLMPDSTYYFQARSDPDGRGEELSFYVN